MIPRKISWLFVEWLMQATDLELVVYPATAEPEASGRPVTASWRPGLLPVWALPSALRGDLFSDGTPSWYWSLLRQVPNISRALPECQALSEHCPWTISFHSSTQQPWEVDGTLWLPLACLFAGWPIDLAALKSITGIKTCAPRAMLKLRIGQLLCCC